MNDTDLDDNLIDLDTLGDDPLYPGQGRPLSDKIKRVVFNKRFLLPLVIILIFVLIASISINVVFGVLVITDENENTPTPIDTIENERTLFWRNLSSTVHSAMDKTANPCVDFYQYACGGWIKQTTIPPDKVAVEKSFSTVDDQNQITLNKIMNDRWPMIGTLYDNCMDQKTRNETGGTPLIPYLQKIKEVTRENFMTKLSELHVLGLSGFFSFYVSPDLYNPELNRLDIDQGGTGLPSKDYYFSNSTFSSKARDAYKQRISYSLALINPLVNFNSTNSEASLPFDQQAENIFQFETLLAGSSLYPVQRRDLASLSNIHTFDELSNDISPNLNWEAYFTGLGIPSGVDELNIAVPSFFEDLNELIPATSIDLIQNYMRWHLVKDTSKILSAEYFDAFFAYYQAVNGVDEPPSASKMCTGAVNSILGMLVGRYFIQETWSQESQAIAQHLIDTIKQSFHKNLLNISWMDQQTQEEAFTKLAAVNDKVGHPIDSEWPDYQGLTIYPGFYFNNTIEGWKYEIAGMIAEAGKPVDKNKWEMYPQDVNAYYDPQLNEMVFPAAILQEPFFLKSYPTPMNYGGIGSVMGHELTHGFDDQGSEFDASGAFVQWWTPESYENFVHQTDCVVDLYDNFQVSDDLHVNGEQTLGENIADMGGIKDAHGAMRQALLPGEADDIQRYFDMTPDQLYFVSYGQVWCAKMHPEHEAVLINSDVHSPPKARVNLPLSQYSAFGEAFQCTLGEPMNPEEKCSVW